MSLRCKSYPQRIESSNGTEKYESHYIKEKFENTFVYTISIESIEIYLLNISIEYCLEISDMSNFLFLLFRLRIIVKLSPIAFVYKTQIVFKRYIPALLFNYADIIFVYIVS